MAGEAYRLKSQKRVLCVKEKWRYNNI
uniref:Uncharacterized protein n=1 Tax=Anguilla anguilla TaxID=7936 RepID=A0A0E9TTY9_ANGAN